MSRGGAQREVELKLELPAERARQAPRHPWIRRHAHGEARTRLLRSVYFDTVDRVLRRAGLALRIREIGERRVQTLKAGVRARAGLFEREEDEVEIEGDVPEPQAVADATLRGTLQRTLAGRTLRAVFVTDMQRTEQPLRFGPDRFRLDLDVGEVRAGGRSEPLCELELELLRGSPRRLFDAALALCDDLELRIGLVSKAARGYALAEGRRARPPLDSALARMRAQLDAVPEGRRAEIEADLAGFEREWVTARGDADREALHGSRRFTRRALELGRYALG